MCIRDRNRCVIRTENVFYRFGIVLDAFLDGKRNAKNYSYCAPAVQVFDDFCGPSPLGLVAEITVGELQKCVISRAKHFVIIILAWEIGGSSREPLRTL